MKFFVSLFLVLSSTVALAGLGDDFAKLKDVAGTADYEVVGTVCEQVAKLRFEEEFPAGRYTVTTGVEYGDGRRTIGELDVVVIENMTSKVVRVTEVKCWKDFKGALKKAHEQRNRFIRTLKSNIQIKFKSLSSNLVFTKANFSNVREYMAVAQKGSKNAGFDRELSYDLKELMQLRMMMIQCQHQGVCR